MKNVKNANYVQEDNKIEICKAEGIEILNIADALKKHNWARRYIKGKPTEGYFIWIKKAGCSVSSCVCIVSENIKQEMQNLVVIEKGINANLHGICNSRRSGLNGVHLATGCIILREGASLNYSHLHSWNASDKVQVNYGFILEKNSKLHYNYRLLSPPKNLSLETKIVCLENSRAEVKTSGIGRNCKISIKESLILQGNNSGGVLKLRVVGKEKCEILSRSSITAKAECKGHLDCQGLLIDKNSKISLIPQLICESTQAQITHEASIGKISEEELHYLRTRGLKEHEAIDLIINGFLEQFKI